MWLSTSNSLQARPEGARRNANLKSAKCTQQTATLPARRRAHIVSCTRPGNSCLPKQRPSTPLPAAQPRPPAEQRRRLARPPALPASRRQNQRRRLSRRARSQRARPPTGVPLQQTAPLHAWRTAHTRSLCACMIMCMSSSL